MTMKKILFLSSLAIAAAFTVSCNKENIEGEGIPTDGEAVLFAAPSVINASSASTKTTLDGTSILWAEGDAITLFGENGAPVEYTLVSGAGTKSGQFENQAVAGQVTAYAVYPATENTLADSKVAVTVAAAQNYVADGFPTDYPMAAVTENGTDFTFENLATVLRLQLKGDATVASVTVRTLGENEYIAGAAAIDFTSGTPVLAASAEGAASAVTLNCGDGVALSTDNETSFNFILIPGDYSGFEVTVTDANGHETVRTTGALELLAGTVKGFEAALDIYSTPHGWNLTGSFTNDWSSWINLNEFNGLAYFMNVEIPESNSFKVRYNDTWYGLGTDSNQTNPISVDKRVAIYIDSDNNGKGNMSVPAGTYDIYYDIEWNSITFRTAGTSPFSIIGLGGDWYNDKEMTFENGYFVYRNAEFTSDNASFKIRTTGAEWTDYNIGISKPAGEGTPLPTFDPDTDIDVVKLSGENITMKTTGTYDIWFDFGAKKVWVMTPGQVPAAE